MHDAILLGSARRRARAYRARALSPVEAIRAVPARIETPDRALNAHRHLGEPQGLLDGMPVSIEGVLLTRPGLTLTLAPWATKLTPASKETRA